MNKMSIYPQVRFNYCCADYINSFVIDNEGYLYKCWNHVGRKHTSCGNLLSGESQFFNKNHLKWILRNPAKSEKCKDCKYLPICAGGCPDRMLEENEAICDTVKFNLDKVLQYYYNTLKGSEAK